jgi:kinesin family protein 5
MSEGAWFGGMKEDAGKENNNSSEESMDHSTVWTGDASINQASKPSASHDLTASVHSVDPVTGRVVAITPDVGLREFVFESVFPSGVNQGHVYQTVTSGIIVDVLNGFNATILVYGQTGAGKTHTMFGADDESIYGNSLHSAGIVPRSLREILVATKSRETDIESRLFVSYVEVFGEHVIDLLRGGVRCGHSKVAAQRYVLSGAAEKEIRTASDVSALMRDGEKVKRKAATEMNERSSRAHSLIIIKIRQQHKHTDKTMTSSLFLVDLGGSEQVVS